MNNTLANPSPLALRDLLGDLAPIVRQLGSPQGAAPFFPADLPSVRNAEELKEFIEAYQERLMFPLELPAIRQAYSFAASGQARELVALDQSLSADTRLATLATASHRTGRIHLKRLRPLQDQRLVQRYLHAVDVGHAAAWHTIVYGLTLAVFSIPLRPGLIHYAERTAGGFLEAGADRLELTAPDRSLVLSRVGDRGPAAVDALLRTETLRGPAVV